MTNADPASRMASTQFETTWADWSDTADGCNCTACRMKRDFWRMVSRCDDYHLILDTVLVNYRQNEATTLKHVVDYVQEQADRMRRTAPVPLADPRRARPVQPEGDGR